MGCGFGKGGWPPQSSTTPSATLFLVAAGRPRFWIDVCSARTVSFKPQGAPKRTPSQRPPLEKAPGFHRVLAEAFAQRFGCEKAFLLFHQCQPEAWQCFDTRRGKRNSGSLFLLLELCLSFPRWGGGVLGPKKRAPYAPISPIFTNGGGGFRPTFVANKSGFAPATMRNPKRSIVWNGGGGSAFLARRMCRSNYFFPSPGGVILEPRCGPVCGAFGEGNVGVIIFK